MNTSPQDVANADPNRASSDLTSVFGPELLQVWEFYWRRRYFLLCCSFGTLLIAFGYLCAVGARYESQALLYYKVGTEIVPPPTVNHDQVVITRRKEDVNNEIEILSSPHLMRRVVEEFGESYFEPPPPTTTWGKVKFAVSSGVKRVKSGIQDVLIGVGLQRRLTRLEEIEISLLQQLEVDVITDADVLSVKLTTPSPEIGVEILESLLAAYRVSHLEAHQEEGVREFFTEQTKLLKDELTQRESTLLDFRMEHQIWTDDEHSDLAALRRSLRQEIVMNEARIASLETETTKLSSTLDAMPENIVLSRTEQTNPGRVSIEDRLAAVSLVAATVTSSYGPGTPEEQQVRAQLESLQDTLQSRQNLVPHQETVGVNVMRQSLDQQLVLKQAELEGLLSLTDVIRDQLTSVEARLRDVAAQQTKIREMRRETESLAKTYALYSNNIEEARIAAVMNEAAISNFKVISPPTAMLIPTGPRLKIVLLASAAFGIALGSALALLREILQMARDRRSSVAISR